MKNTKEIICHGTMTISVLGDGCSPCNPEPYIDMLKDQLEEAEGKLEKIGILVASQTGDWVEDIKSVLEG